MSIINSELNNTELFMNTPALQDDIVETEVIIKKEKPECTITELKNDLTYYINLVKELTKKNHDLNKRIEKLESAQLQSENIMTKQMLDAESKRLEILMNQRINMIKSLISSQEPQVKHQEDTNTRTKVDEKIKEYVKKEEESSVTNTESQPLLNAHGIPIRRRGRPTNGDVIKQTRVIVPAQETVQQQPRNMQMQQQTPRNNNMQMQQQQGMMMQQQQPRNMQMQQQQQPRNMQMQQGMMMQQQQPRNMQMQQQQGMGMNQQPNMLQQQQGMGMGMNQQPNMLQQQFGNFNSKPTMFNDRSNGGGGQNMFQSHGFMM